MERIIELGAAYRESKILLVAVAYNLFDHLEEPRSAEELASTIKAQPEALELLLNALVALGFIEKTGDRYRNSPEASRYLVSSSSDYLGYWLKHANRGFAKWAKLEEAIFWHAPEEEDRLAFLLALDSIAAKRAYELARAVNLEGKRSLVDLGGGSGAYAIAFAQRYRLAATIVELPETASATREILKRKGVAGIRVLEADFLRDDFGKGYDAALVSNIIHFLSEEDNRTLFRRVYDALAEGGVVIVHDYILDDSKVAPREAAIFALHMLLSSEGRTYSWSEVEAWLREAGFKQFERIELSESRVVVGRK
jgi:SAM-dependent methyltransferase